MENVGEYTIMTALMAAVVGLVEVAKLGMKKYGNGHKTEWSSDMCGERHDRINVAMREMWTKIESNRKRQDEHSEKTHEWQMKVIEEMAAERTQNARLTTNLENVVQRLDAMAK